MLERCESARRIRWQECHDAKSMFQEIRVREVVRGSGGGEEERGVQIFSE